jgi:hypothetical protein
MELYAFITTNSWGDLLVVCGKRRFFLPQALTRDLLCPECSCLLLSSEGLVDGGSTLSFLGRENLVLFALHDRMFSLRYTDFLDVLGGDIQWMRLLPVQKE